MPASEGGESNERVKQAGRNGRPTPRGHSGRGDGPRLTHSARAMLDARDEPPARPFVLALSPLPSSATQAGLPQLPNARPQCKTMRPTEPLETDSTQRIATSIVEDDLGEAEVEEDFALDFDYSYHYHSDWTQPAFRKRAQKSMIIRLIN